MSPAHKTLGPLRRACILMGRDRWLQLVALSTLSVVLAIVGTYLALCINLSASFEKLSSGTTIMAVLKPGIPKDQAGRLLKELTARQEVYRVNYVDKSQALERFARQLGPHKNLLDGLEQNPLPDALEIFLDPNAPSQKLLDDLASTKPVAEVITSRPWLTRLGQAAEVFTELAWALGTLLFVGIILVASNTVRLAVYVRRDQLEILDLVGASLNYIRTPFLLEAVLQALVSSCVASLLVWLLFWLLGGPLSLPLGLDLGNIFSFPWLVVPILALAAMIAALAGGFLGVGRALRPTGSK